MQKSFLLDLTLSAQAGEQYWSALRKRALPTALQVQLLDKKSVYWPLSIYLRRGISELDSKHLTSPFAGNVLKEYAALEKLFPNYSSLLEYPVLDNQEQVFSAKLKLIEALERIKILWPEGYEEFKKVGLGISWFSSVTRYSYSTPKVFGVLFINPIVSNFSVHTLATSIIHEMAHQALFVESAIDKLLPEDFAKPVFSPLRKEMRPAIAALHALVAMARMLIWSQRMNLGNEIEQEEGRVLRDKLRPFYSAAIVEISSLRFSARGRLLLNDLIQIESKLGLT